MAKHGATRRGVFVLSLISLLAGGCYSAAPLNIESPGSYAFNEKVGAVQVGAKPFDTPSESRSMFGADVTHRYQPILVVVQNDGSEVEIVERAEILLRSSDGIELRPITALRAARTFQYALDDDEAWSPRASMNADSPGGPMEQDWVRKELPATTNLRPGKRVGGIVYFSKAGRPPFTLRVDVLGMRSQKTQFVEIGLPGVAPADE